MSDKRRFNKLKLEVLRLLSQRQASSMEVATMLGLELTNACDVLWRLYRKRQSEGEGHLINRVKIITGRPGRPHYVYEINSRGLERLDRLMTY